MRRVKKTILLMLIAGSITFAFGNCASRVVYVRKAPPPVRVEVRSARPFPNAVWIAGHWQWNGVRFVWVSGKWVKPQSGRVWVPGHWRQTRHGWRWVPGRWKRI